MKKKFISVIALALMATLAVTMTACGSKKTATYYGIVHNHYLGEATVTLDGDKVTVAKLDEIFMPYDWAKATATVKAAADDFTTPAAELDDPVLTAAQGEGVLQFSDKIVETNANTTNADPARHTVASKALTAYALIIRIGDKHFGADLKGGSGSGVYSELVNNMTVTETGITNGGIEDLKAKVNTDQATAKWYRDRMMAGDYKLCEAVQVETAGFKKITLTIGTSVQNVWVKDSSINLFAYGKINKSESTYGGSWQAGKGWENNVKAMCDFVKANGFEYAITDLTQDATTKVWKVKDSSVTDGTVSATLTDFKDYMMILKGAYTAAKAK